MKKLIVNIYMVVINFFKEVSEEEIRLSKRNNQDKNK